MPPYDFYAMGKGRGETYSSGKGKAAFNGFGNGKGKGKGKGKGFATAFSGGPAHGVHGDYDYYYGAANYYGDHGDYGIYGDHEYVHSGGAGMKGIGKWSVKGGSKKKAPITWTSTAA